MSKQITHISCPKEWEITNDWDSHKPALWLCLKKIHPNSVVECGCGYGSTILLDKHCENFGSFETNIEWFDKMSKDVPNSLVWVEDWDSFAIEKCDLLFIDCAPGEVRKDLISRYSNDAKVIVAHDTEDSADYVYRMSEILSTFKYRLDYQPEKFPHTTVVSNFINVTEWVK